MAEGLDSDRTIPTSAAGAMSSKAPEAISPDEQLHALREGGDFELLRAGTPLLDFLSDWAGGEDLTQADLDKFALACAAADIAVSGVMLPLLYDSSEGIFYPSLECIAGIVLACQMLAGRPLRVEQLFAGVKIRAAVLSATPRPPGGRSAHNVRQVFGEGCPESCTFCLEVVVFEPRADRLAFTRVRVPARELLPLTAVLNLNTRAARALARVGIETPFDLRLVTARTLAGYKAIGKKTLDHVLAEADRAGIKLGSVPNPTGDSIRVSRLQRVPPRRKAVADVAGVSGPGPILPAP